MGKSRVASIFGKLVLIVILIPLLAVAAQYGLLLRGSQLLQTAASSGAEEASSAQGTRASVLAAVADALEGQSWRDKVHTDVVVAGVLDVGQTQGTELGRARAGSRVQVEVSAPAVDVVKDLFSASQFSIRGLKLSAVGHGERQ